MIRNKTSTIMFVESLPDDCMIRCTQVTETRSQAQNRVYWGFLKDLSDYLKGTGMMMTSEALHRSFSQIFIEGTNSVCSLTNEIVTDRKSTTKLNKKEFSKYIEDIRNYLVDSYDIDIPLRTEFYNLINNYDKN